MVATEGVTLRECDGYVILRHMPCHTQSFVFLVRNDVLNALVFGATQDVNLLSALGTAAAACSGRYKKSHTPRVRRVCVLTSYVARSLFCIACET